MHSLKNNPALAYSFQAILCNTSCSQSFVSDIFAKVFGKKLRVNAEINPIFILSPKILGPAWGKENQELHTEKRF
jgi:hypothetical protein